MEGIPEGAGMVGWLAALGAFVWAAYERLSPKLAEKRARNEEIEDALNDAVSNANERLLDRVDSLLTRVEKLEDHNDAERRLRITAENRVAVLMQRLITLGRSDLTEFSEGVD